MVHRAVLPPPPKTVPPMRESTAPVRSVLRHIDAAALQPAIRRETRARQRHLPPVSVYRWWARRTETVTGAVVDAVSADRPGRLVLADVFAGGGVIALAGLLRGHQVYAQDVNPWAASSLTTMLSLPPADSIGAAAQRLQQLVQPVLQRAYATELADGTPAQVAHTLRVATGDCPRCSTNMRLFPRSLVSLLTRVDTGGTQGWMACASGHLTLGSAVKRIRCTTCDCYVWPQARYTVDRRARCWECGWIGKLTELDAGPFRWEPVLVERAGAGRREIAQPTDTELAAASTDAWAPAMDLGPISDGIETSVLLRHGIDHWHDLYPARQRALIEALLNASVVAADGDLTVLQALKAAVIGSAEMAGYVSRWDGRYLKAYEAVANHRFNFTTLAAEPNVWGAPESGRGTVVRRLQHLEKASMWLDEKIGRPLHVEGPVPAEERRRTLSRLTDARVVVGSSERICLPTGSADAVITDPPYHDDVHYGELSDLFRCWSGTVTGALDGDAVVRRSSSATDGTAAYEALLERVFTEVHRSLRSDGHLVLSYANRNPAAWVALFNALQNADFRAVGYNVVHSENETDHAKAGRRACTRDLLVDLVKACDTPLRRHRPKPPTEDAEELYCELVGSWALRVGSLPSDWSAAFETAAKASAFLAVTVG